MQIVTLEQVKWELNITHTAQDTRLTDLANRVEGETLNYLDEPTYDTLVATLCTRYSVTELDTSMVAPLQAAVLWMVKARFKGQDATPRTGFAAQLLISYRGPKFSSGTTA